MFMYLYCTDDVPMYDKPLSKVVELSWTKFI